MTDLAFLSGAEALARFKARTLSPVELLDAVIAKAEAANPRLNFITDAFYETAREGAKLAEARYARTGELPRALEGLPLGVKEEFKLAGTRRASGSLVYADRFDDDTDEYVRRFVAAGAIPVFKTTVPEFCILGTTHSRQWGVTRNPWNPEISPGGSSGGSAAALAVGACTLATGSDIGGSIRIPASLCGIVGYKPPYGRNPEIPIYNLDFFSHSGPLARSVADLALMQNATSGVYARDIASLRERIAIATLAPPDLRNWKIAYSLDLGYAEIDSAVEANTLAALDIFRALGATVEPVELGWTADVEAAATAYLNHLMGASLIELLRDRRELLTDYAVAQGEAALKSTPKDFFDALCVIHGMYESFGPLLDRYDIFVCPTLRSAEIPADLAPGHGAFGINGREVPAHDLGWTLTYPFNMLSRCPVIAMPAGFAPNGVPTGIQLVARSYDDQRVFDAALAYEAASPWCGETAPRPAG